MPQTTQTQDYYQTLDDIYNDIIRGVFSIDEANEIIDTLKIVDPAVGSGHFLVSVLNQILAIKSDLKILQDQNKRLLSDQIKIENDEIIIKNRNGEIFEYNPNSPESQITQKTIFHEKQKIIENCLFGVDINPNSVKICQLRLWIELLKNAYYFEEKRLQTLPNIDINIKCGNSLISRFGLDVDLKKALKGKKYDIETYKLAIYNYQNATDKNQKREFETLINEIKNDFKIEIRKDDPKKEKLKKLNDELFDSQIELIELSPKEQKLKEKRQKEVADQIQKIEAELQDLENNKIYQKAFEWRFEFPQVLNENGDFVGFDVVIGNPPYIMEYENKSAFDGLQNKVGYQGKTDIWHIFACHAVNLTKTNGLISFIAKNQWTESQSASKMREFLYKNTQIQLLIDFGSNMVFDEASVQTMIFLLQKEQVRNHQIHYTKFETNFDSKEIANIIKQNATVLGVKKLIKSIPTDTDPLSNISFTDLRLEPIFKKIENLKNFDFDEKNEIIQGIIGGPDKAFLVDKNDLKNFDSHEREYLKMFHTHTDKYFTPDTDKYIFYLSKNNFDSDKIEEFPNIYNQLLPFKDQLKERREVLKNSIGWSNLWWARDEKFFKEGKRIVWAKRTEGSRFTFTDKAFYGSANLFWVKSNRINLKFLTGVLNSKLFYFYMHQKLKHTGDLLQLDKNQFLKIPIYNPLSDTPQKQEIARRIEALVGEILEVKNTTPRQTSSATPQEGNLEDTTHLESQIDELVFELYGLGEEEKSVVLGGLSL